MDKIEILILDLARKQYGTLYDKTQLDYTYMEYLLDHVEDVSPFRKEIEDFYEKSKEYVVLYEEAIYGQFYRILQQLMKK